MFASFSVKGWKGVLPVPGHCSGVPPSAVLAGKAGVAFVFVPNALPVPPPKIFVPVVPVALVAPKPDLLPPNIFPPVFPPPKAGVVFVVVLPKPPKALDAGAVDVLAPKIEPLVVAAVPKPDGLAPNRLFDVLVVVLAPNPPIGKDGDVSDSNSE
jgi:hypothetical protein